LKSLDYLKKYPEHYYIFTPSGTPGLLHIGRDTLSRRHQRILRQLKYPNGYVFYSWKNTGAVKMLMHDQKNIRYISKCMGHSSLDMTDKYFQSLGVDDMAEQIIFPELV
jgi:integrase